MSDFTYEITEHIATLSKHNGTTIELNRVSFNGCDPKYDIRRWRDKYGDKKMLKGITLSDEEMNALKKAIGGGA